MKNCVRMNLVANVILKINIAKKPMPVKNHFEAHSIISIASLIPSCASEYFKLPS